MGKLIVEIPDEIHGELKRKALSDQKTLKEIITRLIQDYLSGTIKKSSAKKSTGFCGKWEDQRSAKEIIADIKTHRQWSTKTRKQL